MSSAFVVSLLVISALLSSEANAQPPATAWSAPLNLSAMLDRETAGKWGSVSPEIAADSSGGLHVMWAEDLEQTPNETSPCSEAVYYTHWDGESWSEPVDVFAATPGQCVYKIAAQVDSEGTLHALWSSNGGLYHGSVFASDGPCAHCWNIDRVFASVTNADIFIEDGERIHAVYVAGYDTIYYMQSRDGGATWDSPIQVYAVPSADSAVLDARLAVDRYSVVHATWGNRSAETNWISGGVSYARSDDGGRTWEVTLQVQDTGGSPNLGMDGDENLYLVWNHPVGSKDGRYYCRSSDGGVTWSQPTVAFWDMSGQTWWPEMARDSAGTLHLVFAAKKQRDGIWHSTWGGEGWSEPELVSGDLVANENPSLVATEGNRLNAVWVDYDTRSIWFSGSLTSAPGLALVSIPTRQPTRAPTSSLSAGGLSPTPASPVRTEMPFGSEPMPSAPATQWPVFLGIVPTLLLVGGALLVRILRRR